MNGLGYQVNPQLTPAPTVVAVPTPAPPTVVAPAPTANSEALTTVSIGALLLAAGVTAAGWWIAQKTLDGAWNAVTSRGQKRKASQ